MISKYDDYDWEEEDELDDEINLILKRKRITNQKRSNRQVLV